MEKLAVCPTPVSDKEDRPFVDREEFIEAFETAFQNIGNKNYSVLVYYGIGGIGKTSLRKELPKKLDEYNEKYQNTGVIWATVDFSIESHRQMDKFLGILKNELNQKCGVKFHLFDIAHATYWRKVNPQIPLSREGYSEDSIVTDLLDSFGGLFSINYSSIKSVVERAPDRFKEWSLKREKDIARLPDMEALDIEKMLPVFFANDLADYLQKTSQSAVIFIDSYEALWEKKRGQGSFSSRDEWIRQLIANLPKSSLWVLCGRDELRWEEVDKDWYNYIEQYKLEKLPEKDAFDFLNRCGIKEEEIQKVIIEGSEGVPYYLELAVDTYSEIAKTRSPKPDDFATTHSEIFDRFMKYLGVPEKETLKVLSTPRFWNQDIFKALINNFNTGYPLTAFSELNRFSFVQETEGKLQLHPLMRESLQVYQAQDLKTEVHSFMRDHYSDKIKDIDIKAITPEHETALTEAFYHAKEALEAEKLFRWFISVSNPFLKAAYWKLNLPLYEEMLQILEKSLFPTHPYVCTVLNNLAGIYENIGNYGEALSLYQKVLDIREKTLGIEHLDVENSLNNLAALQYRLGNYREALHNYQKALNISEKFLGPEHPSIAITLNNLGELHKTIGNYKEAFSLYQRALDIRKKMLSPEHPDVAINLSTLAGLYKIFGNCNKALPLYQSAIKIFENVYGSEHPETAKTLSNLAGLYWQRGMYEEALPLYQSALKTFEQVYGPEHPGTAKVLDDLSILYSHIGKYEESLTLNQRALRIFEGSLGKEHIDFATSLNNSAMIYKKMGDYQKALLLYQETLDIVENALGKEHLYVATTLNNLATVYEHLGNYKKALPLYQRALTIREKVLGSDHQEVAQTLNNLASLHRSTMNYEKALPLYKRSIEIAEKKLGEENDFTATMYNNLAELYRNMGNYEAALPLYQKALKIFENIFGIEHPKVATILNNLATLYSGMKKYEEALPYCQQAFRIRSNILEQQHPEIGITLNNLAGIYCQLEKYDEAIPLFEQALNIFESKLGSEHPYYLETMNNLTALYSKMTVHIL